MHEVSAARRHEPSAKVRAQLECLPALGSAEFWRQVQTQDPDSPDWLEAEVLVSALRRLLYLGRVDDAERIATVLIERWGRFILKRAFAWFPDSPECREEMRWEVSTRLWQRLKEPSKTFWEANFYYALFQLCYEVGRSLSKQESRQSPGFALQAEDDEGEDGEEVGRHPRDLNGPVTVIGPDGQRRVLPGAERRGSPTRPARVGPRTPSVRGPDDEPEDELEDQADAKLQSFDEWCLSREAKARLGRALASLPKPVATAVYLRYVEGWQIHSKDPSEQTISDVLGVTEKTVRNYLRRGEALLREWYEKERADGRA